jgi:pSer/pThr/pTyr-binding forkhead associated (FHA) protein
MVLESITLENKHSRMVHILHPKKEYSHRMLDVKHYRIGRGQDCDIKITDISVSRNHCKINFRNGNFFLEDTGSKFGTLLMSRGKIAIHPYTTIGV